MGWLRLASHLKMSLDDVKRKTSSFQFALWMEYLEWEINAFDKQCWYLAQIAAEVHRPYAPKGRRIDVKDFIPTFSRKQIEPKVETPVAVQMKANKDKQFFFGLTGLTGSAKKGKRRP